MSKIVLDTNILIYSIDEESQYFDKAQKIIFNSNLELFTTSKNLSEFLSVITRIPDSSLLLDEALTIVQDLLFKYKPIGLKIHDFEIMSIALSNEIRTLATLNVKDYKEVSEIEIYPL